MSLPAYLQPSPEGQERVRKSRAQEKSTAKKFGGRVIRGSGSGMEKGDVNVGSTFKVECKRTDGQTITIDRRWFQKIETEAFSSRRRPLLVLDFQDEPGRPDQRWVCIREQDFLAFQEFVQYLDA